MVQAPADKMDMYLDFFLEVVRRTAQLAAAWQCVGFCHGAPLMRASGLYKRVSILLERLGSGPV